MTKTLLEKMFFKPDYDAVLLHVPSELKTELQITNQTDSELKTTYNFMLAFYSKKETLEKEIPKIKQVLQQDGLLWIAYPKGKALQTDLNRDILHARMRESGLDGVSLVSLNDTWSAMRFKKL